jgi:DNA ligase-1
VQLFTDLFLRLDATTSRNAKVEAMADYFEAADPADAAWAVYYLSGRRPKRLVQSATMREWAAGLAGIPDWLIEECYTIAGDTAETIALLLPEAESTADAPLHVWVEDRLLPLRDLDEDEQREAMVEAWMQLGRWERFVWNKLITSGFRVGVSKKLLVRGLEAHSGIDRDVLMHRLMGDWTPSADFYRRLLSEDTTDADRSRPYPFLLAQAIDGDPTEVLDGSLEDYQAEWKRDGIRAQIVRRGGEVYIWSRGEELVTDRYPDVRDAADGLPDGLVLDGEMLAWKNGEVLPFGQLQRRIGRKTVPKKLRREVPIHFLAFDVLEAGGEDVRERPLAERRALLEDVLASAGVAPRIRTERLIETDGWDRLAGLRADSRSQSAEGLMLKRRDKPYEVGRPAGNWWKWKVEPHRLDGVLIYARRGSGRRATLYTDYTFALWDDDELVTFAKAYSGLTDDQLEEVDTFVRQNTIDRFGPVRAVEPELVMEIAFAGVRRSNRHKCGVAVRFPRIERWRRDLSPDDADTLEDLQRLLPELPDGVEG